MTRFRKRVIGLGLQMLILLLICSNSFANERLRMSTTTSTENSGLLKVLLPPFEKRYNCTVDVISVGTGKALKLGETGDVDVVLVHARALEDAFIANGFGVNRHDVMYNDFIIIGPASDPAGVGKAKSTAEAFKKIAENGSTFISRGDESGTHQKEREIWKGVGSKPSGKWYVEAGQGMGEVISMATERRAYTLADRGTYNAYRTKKTDLKIVFEGEKGLFNPYGVIAVNPKRFPHVKFELANKFIDYITGPEGQKIIATYRVSGDPVFFIYQQKGK